MLKPEHTGKVVVGGVAASASPALRRAMQVGRARRVVVGGLDDQDLAALLGYDLGVAITGQRAIGCTVVVTEGFGQMTMAHRTFDLLEKFRRAGRSRSTARPRSGPA